MIYDLLLSLFSHLGHPPTVRPHPLIQTLWCHLLLYVRHGQDLSGSGTHYWQYRPPACIGPPPALPYRRRTLEGSGSEDSPFTPLASSTHPSLRTVRQDWRTMWTWMLAMRPSQTNPWWNSNLAIKSWRCLWDSDARGGLYQVETILVL